MPSITKLIDKIIKQQASDLHLVPGNYPALRVDQAIIFLEEESLLDKNQIIDLIDYFLNEEQKQIFNQRKKISVGYNFEQGLRGRINITYQKGLPAIYIRFVPAAIKGVKELTLPNVLVKFLEWERGLILLTGPFNSGRSTTAAALINEVNYKTKKYIVTLEQPIEHVFAANKSIIEQWEIGVDATSYEQALRELQERDVDLVFIDKLEGVDVIKEALALAQSNGLVIAVGKADSSFSALEELIYDFPAAERLGMQKDLSECLKAIIAQRLLPKIGGGIALAYEILIVNQVVKLLISEGNLNQIDNVLQTSRDEGMIALDQKLAELVGSGLVNREEALKAAINPDTLQALLH